MIGSPNPATPWSAVSPPGFSTAAIVPLPLLADGLVGWVVIAAVVAAIVATTPSLWRKYRPGRPVRATAAPPLIFPAAPAAGARTRTRPPPPLVPFASSPPPFPVPVASGPMEVAAATAAAATAVVDEVAAPPEPSRQAPASTPEPALFEGRTIKFHVPQDGTLQLLPGRLELVAGPDSGQVIRFVRGDRDSEVTFGRSEGPPYRHVQLRVPTVSRRHARMRMSGSRWNIANLSSTNPLLVNGEELGTGAAGRALTDGDRIEMGELVFVYRER